MKSFGLIGLVAAASMSQAVLIDSFAGGTSFLSIGGVPKTTVATATGLGILTGERDIQMSILTNPLNQFFDLTFGSGLAISSSGFGLWGRLQLQYDAVGDEVGNIGVGNVLTNSSGVLGLAGQDAVRITWAGNDLDVNVNVILLQAGSIIDTGSGAGIQTIGMSAAAMAVADSITIEFNPAASGDFAADRIETVPKPATMTALGLGAAALLRRRAQKA